MKISIIVEDMPNGKTSLTYVYPLSHNSTTAEPKITTNAERVVKRIEELVRNETLFSNN